MEQHVFVNVGNAMLLVHHAITRGVDVGVEKSDYYGKNGFPDPASKAGFLIYIIGLSAALRLHHVTEDELAFPYLQQRVPDAPYDVLDSEHRVIEPLVLQMRATAERLFGNEGDELTGLESLHALLVSVREAWGPHIQKEEQYFTPEKLDFAILPEQHAAFARALKEFSQSNASPDYLVLPFLLYNLAEPERSEFSEELPPFVLQQLIPVAWKAKWEPMKPFLLP